MNRVVVTGLGCVTSCGNSPQDLFDNLCNKKQGLKLIDSTRFSHIKPTVVGEPSFTPTIKVSGTDISGQYAVEAANQAIKDSGITDFGSRTGVYIGNGAGGVATADKGYQSLYVTHKKMNALTILGMMPSSAASAISLTFQTHGPTMTFNGACASGSMAIGEAYKAIQSGRLDCVIAGGTEGVISEGLIAAWQRIGALADIDESNPASSSRPFSKDRSGFCLSEGSAILVLESLESAQARGADIYAEITGYGYSSDGYHWTKPDTNGQTNAINMAIQEANVTPSQIGYCNAHGTGTPVGDPEECQSLKTVWGSDINLLEVSSTKGQLGHMIGAAGAVEFLITVMALKSKQIPPTINLTELDPDCNINIVTETKNSPNLTTAMSNSFAFGGSNVVLIASTKDL